MAYSGKGMQRASVKENEKINFDGAALVGWFCSHLISLLPLYISIIKWWGENGTINITFWKEAFLHGDILWVFSTILLFSITETISKRKSNRNKLTEYLLPVGMFAFVIMEATWITFNHILQEPIDEVWPLCLGIILSGLSILISTPLKITYIKGEK